MKRKPKENIKEAKQSQRQEKRREIKNCLNKEVEMQKEVRIKCNVSSNSFKCHLKHQKTKTCHKIR
jgi:hypothetical protein